MRVVQLVVVASIALVGWACESDRGPTAPGSATASPTSPVPSPPNNPVTALKVSAGEDVWLPSPGSALVLRSFASGSSDTTTSYSWRKVSGPASFSIESPQSRQTTVANLAQGTYEFEVTATARDGSRATDSVNVHVYDPRGPGTNEFTFRNIPWYCPMGCSATIDNFPFPASMPVKVVVKSAGDEGWTEIKPEAQWMASDRFVFGFGNNRLWIYANDESGSIDLRIIF